MNLFNLFKRKVIPTETSELPELGRKLKTLTDKANAEADCEIAEKKRKFAERQQEQARRREQRFLRFLEAVKVSIIHDLRHDRVPHMVQIPNELVSYLCWPRTEHVGRAPTQSYGSHRMEIESFIAWAKQHGMTSYIVLRYERWFIGVK